MLELTLDGNTATLLLDRPKKRNALSIALRDEIERALTEVENDDRISVVIVRSNGPVFCAGFDIDELRDRSPEHIAAVNESSERYHRRLAELTKPAIAGIQGPAMGGGFDLAVLCDLRIATPEARFAHPEVKFGAPALFDPLRQIVGGGLARDLVFTGRSIDAQEALRNGLVSQVVPATELEEACLRLARVVAEAPLGTLRAVKRQIVASYGGWKSSDGGNIFDDL